MQQPPDLNRFVNAQQTTYNTALAEVQAGRKQSHWMWFTFPQVQGLGFSETARYYAVQNKAEAVAYLQHPVLGSRLVEICTALLKHKTRSAHQIFGSPDDLKLHSCLTLFAALPAAPPVFTEALQQFFEGRPDEKTIRLLAQFQK